MRATGPNVQIAFALALLTALLLAPASARGDGAGSRIAGQPAGFRPLPPLLGPAGPTPLNPAGPTPLNPAGRTPVNPGGPSIGMPRHGVRIQQPGVFVGVVGGNDWGVPLQGSFFCQVHNRGYATQSLFFDHLAAADGVRGDEVMSYLVEDGGVWIFPVE